jgi:hypothetical protein
MKRKSALAVVIGLALTVMACNAATVQAYITLAVQIAVQIAQLAGVPASMATQVSTDLATAQGLIAAYNSAPAADKVTAAGKVDTALTVAQNDLTAILAASHVASRDLQGTIQAGLAIGITAIEGIRAIAIANTPAPVVAQVAHASAATARAVLPGATQVIVPKGTSTTPAQLKALYNRTVKNYPQAQLK